MNGLEASFDLVRALAAAADAFQAACSVQPQEKSQMIARLRALGRAIEAFGPPPPGVTAVAWLATQPGGPRAWALFCGGVTAFRVDRLAELGETSPWSTLLIEAGAGEA